MRDKLIIYLNHGGWKSSLVPVDYWGAAENTN